MNNRLINTKVAAAAGCTDIVDNYDPFGGNGVALYQLNGNANDVSGNYNGTASNVTYGTGVFGQAGVFNGSSSFINLGASSQFSSSAVTFSLWYKPDTVSNIGALLANTNGGSYELGEFYWYQWNDGKFLISYGQSSTTYVQYFSTSTFSVGTWYFLSFVIDPSATNKFRLYINGAEDTLVVNNQGGTFTAHNVLDNSLQLNMGKRNISGSENYLDGSLDQVRIFNTALTPLEVEALYTEELCICDGTVDTLDILGDGSCIATYQLDGNANDLSGNYSGTPTDVSYGVGEFDLAGVFNGSSSIIKNGDLGVDFRGQTELSLSCWFKTNQSVTLQSLFGFSATGDASTELFVNIRSGEGDALGFINRNDGAGTVEVRASGSGSVIDNVWHNVVFVASASGTKLYLDGSELTNMTYRTGSASTQISMPSDLNQFNIGGSQDSGGIEFLYNGSIDQVRIFNKALNSTEVTTLYNETACASNINLDRDPIRHWGLDNTLASTKPGYSALQKTSASYTTGRFGQALTFARGNTASETSTSYGDIWTDVTKANFLQGSISFWFKPGSINQRNIVTYSEKIPPFGLEFSTENKLSITSFLDTNTYSPETYGTSDIIFVCITANRTGGTGSTQTCDFTMYYSSVSENNLKSISNSGTSTESTYTGTFCLGHGASSVGFSGWIDQFRLFDKPLNSEQAQALFDEAPY